MHQLLDNCLLLFLRSIRETEDGGIMLAVEEGKPGKTQREDPQASKEWQAILLGTKQVESSQDSLSMTIYWPSYIAYSVEDESFLRPDDTSEYTGRRLRAYTKSAYLDYLGNVTFADNQFPGPFTHWSVRCEDHIINVASTERPAIRISPNLK